MARRTGLVTHERYYWHDNGPAAGTARPDGWSIEPGAHVESPESKRRLQALLAASGYIDRLTPISPRPATRDELLRFHTPAHVDVVATAAAWTSIGRQAVVGPGSYDIALLAAGGVIAATDAVISGHVTNAYALVRPPGHHAEADRAMGFCLFGNIVVAALHARAVHGVRRIAIVDWDVHHGNGTQSAFYTDPEALTISIHQDGRFPRDSGSLAERGEADGVGTNINVPLPPGSGHGAYLDALERVIVPALRRFRPDLIFVASGYDAGGYDPMAHMMAHTGTFRAMAEAVVQEADELAGGQLVVVHEGGYSAFHVPFCGLAVIEAMSGEASGIDDPFASLAGLPYQDLQPHQAAIIDAAASYVAEIPVAGA
jgi:acetoin utilization deacetylase AcuC-like enzyme